MPRAAFWRCRSFICNIGAHTALFVPLNKGVQLMTPLSRAGRALPGARRADQHAADQFLIAAPGGRKRCTLIERLMDLAARECGFDRVELRRRNMIPAKALP